MPELRIHYRFTGDKNSFSEIEVAHPDVNVQRLFENLNHIYNDERPPEEPYREIINIEVVDAWKHIHSFQKVLGFEYYECMLCGCKAARRNERWDRLQGWEEEEYEYCRERPPKLPKLKVSNLVISDIEIPEPEPEPDPNARKKLKKFKL